MSKVKAILPIDQRLTPLADIGINLTNQRFRNDVEDIMLRAKSVGLNHLICTGTSIRSSRDAIKLCREFDHSKLPATQAAQLPRLFSTVGVHPHDAKDFDFQETPKQMLDLLKDKHVVAVGECGLDFNRNFSPQDVQITVFERQIEIAKTCNKPLFLHERDAHSTFIEILRRHRPALPNKIVVHCFTGQLEHVKDYLELDCYIGFTGFICDEREGRGKHLREVVNAVPANRILIETDGPFIVPRNMPRSAVQSGGRCEPCHLVFVARKLAELRGVLPNSDAYVALMDQIYANTLSVFQLEVDQKSTETTTNSSTSSEIK